VGVLDSFKKVAHAYEQYNEKTQGWAAKKQAKQAKKVGALMQLNSLEGSFTIYEDRLEIVNFLGSKHRVMPYTQIHAVNFDKTSDLAKGGAALLTAGASLLVTNKKRIIINVGVESVAIEFRAESNKRIEQAITLINERIGAKSQASVTVNMPQGSGANQSVADELTKLAKLKADGVLTQAEFETEKKQLLDK